jgi:hypothetical protein
MGQILAVACCGGVILSAYLLFEVGIFRLACSLCHVPAPSFGRTVGVVLLLLIVPVLIDAITTAILVEVYVRAGYPLWEAGVVEFLLAMPIHMGICSYLHSWLLRLPVGECLGVWFVEKIIKSVGVLAVAGITALFILAK